MPYVSFWLISHFEITKGSTVCRPLLHLCLLVVRVPQLALRKSSYNYSSCKVLNVFVIVDRTRRMSFIVAPYTQFTKYRISSLELPNGHMLNSPIIRRVLDQLIIPNRTKVHITLVAIILVIIQATRAILTDNIVSHMLISGRRAIKVWTQGHRLHSTAAPPALTAHTSYGTQASNGHTDHPTTVRCSNCTGKRKAVCVSQSYPNGISITLIIGNIDWYKLHWPTQRFIWLCERC